MMSLQARNSKSLVSKLQDELIDDDGGDERAQVRDELADEDWITAILINLLPQLLLKLFPLLLILDTVNLPSLATLLDRLGHTIIEEFEHASKWNCAVIEDSSAIGDIEQLHPEEGLVHKSKSNILLGRRSFRCFTVEMLLGPSLWSGKIFIKSRVMTIRIVIDELVLLEPDEPDFAEVEDDGHNTLLINRLNNKHKQHIVGKKADIWIIRLSLVQNREVRRPFILRAARATSITLRWCNNPWLALVRQLRSKDLAGHGVHDEVEP